ncbi:MAG: DUF1003 domain-containing protein [Armatimonadota bacterium]
MQQRSPADVTSDAIARFAGSPVFITLNALWFATWIAINSGAIPGIRPFDPFPFTFLTLVVSLEAIFLSTFVLSSQSRMSRLSDQRSHLDLQLNLLAEQESTQALRMLQAISDHLGVKGDARDHETEDLTEKAAPVTLMREIEKKLPKI